MEGFAHYKVHSFLPDDWNMTSAGRNKSALLIGSSLLFLIWMKNDVIAESLDVIADWMTDGGENAV